MKWAAVSTKNNVNLNCLKQCDISEQFVNTILEKLENLDLNSTNSNEWLHNFMYNAATKETLPMQEKQDCTSHAWWYHIKRTIWFERSANCSKCQPNKQSKTPKRTRLDAKFFKSEYFKTEFAKINQSVINRELEKLFSQAKEQKIALKADPGKFSPWENPWSFQKTL